MKLAGSLESTKDAYSSFLSALQTSQVFNSIAQEWAQRTSEMLSETREEKFHINKQPCIILFIIYTQ